MHINTGSQGVLVGAGVGKIGWVSENSWSTGLVEDRSGWLLNTRGVDRAIEEVVEAVATCLVD